MKLFLTGERFTGAEAVAFGLAHRAVGASDLVDAVNEIVSMIRLGGPNAVIECKNLVRRASEVDFQSDMVAGFEEMAEWSLRMFRSEEANEGMSAFREKRKASWVAD
jgi:enoyl-CoA hydratase/carnithine racemase